MKKKCSKCNEVKDLIDSRIKKLEHRLSVIESYLSDCLFIVSGKSNLPTRKKRHQNKSKNIEERLSKLESVITSKDHNKHVENRSMLAYLRRKIEALEKCVPEIEKELDEQKKRVEYNQDVITNLFVDKGDYSSVHNAPSKQTTVENDGICYKSLFNELLEKTRAMGLKETIEYTGLTSEQCMMIPYIQLKNGQAYWFAGDIHNMLHPRTLNPIVK